MLLAPSLMPKLYFFYHDKHFKGTHQTNKNEIYFVGRYFKTVATTSPSPFQLSSQLSVIDSFKNLIIRNKFVLFSVGIDNPDYVTSNDQERPRHKIQDIIKTINLYIQNCIIMKF